MVLGIRTGWKGQPPEPFALTVPARPVTFRLQFGFLRDCPLGLEVPTGACKSFCLERVGTLLFVNREIGGVI